MVADDPKYVDLIMEGGGVKGIGLVGTLTVLEEQGYSFNRVAGTSAGAIVASLKAAGMSARDMSKAMREINYPDLRDEGTIDRLGVVGKGLSLLFEKGIYEGDFLRLWLAGHLEKLGVRTFSDLKIPGATNPKEAYKLVVNVADVSNGRLIRLPWDYQQFGLDPDKQLVVDAVRASTAIPFFYEPVKLAGYYLVDGAILSNFPVRIFEEDNIHNTVRPTLGIKLSARPEANLVANDVGGTIGFAKAILSTMINAHDQRHLDDPCVIRRTIFVDTDKIKPTDFDLSNEAQELLYRNGQLAALKFLKKWDFKQFLATCPGHTDS